MSTISVQMRRGCSCWKILACACHLFSFGVGLSMCTYSLTYSPIIIVSRIFVAKGIRRQMGELTRDDVNRFLLGLLNRMTIKAETVIWQNTPNNVSFAMPISVGHVDPHLFVNHGSPMLLHCPEAAGPVPDYTVCSFQVCETAFCVLMGVNEKRAPWLLEIRPFKLICCPEFHTLKRHQDFPKHLGNI